jgi:hypothetical protein
MNKKFLMMVMAISVIGTACSYARELKCSKDVAILIRDADDYRDAEVHVSGCVRAEETGALRMSPCGAIGNDASGYIDLVGVKEAEVDNAIGLTVCVNGKFRKYDSDFLGMGNLTSEIGLIEVDSIVSK